jgi:HlyD family secretion protein
VSLSRFALRNTLLTALLALVIAGFFFILPGKSKSPVELSGLIQASEVKPASLLGGRVAEILVEEGQMVRQGTPLLRFDEQELASRLKQAKAQVLQAEAQKQLLQQGADPYDVKLAKAQLSQAQEKLKLFRLGGKAEDRAQAQAAEHSAMAELTACEGLLKQAEQALEQGLVSQQAVEQAQLKATLAQQAFKAAQAKAKPVFSGPNADELRMAEAEMRQAEARYQKLLHGAKPSEVTIQTAQVQAAKAVLEGLEAQGHEAQVLAPMDGQVSLLLVNTGELVKAGLPVATVMDTQHLWTDVFVPESLLPALKVNQLVWLKASVYPKALLKGRVAFISPKGNFNTSHGNENTAKNKVGETTYRVKVKLLPQQKQEAARKIPLLPGMSVVVLVPAIGSGS